jgi:uracil-DNA glycosylase family protein
MAARKTASGTAAALIPPQASLAKLREIARGCTACPLYQNATQTVFGEGPAQAALMLIGETAGDQDYLQGRPFVGPAAKLLDRCLAEAGIDRGESYVSNVVKHFKFTLRDKKRLHGKPNAAEIRACKPWLEAEIARVKPSMILCLGATAAQALLGSSFRVSQQRGVLVPSPLALFVMATVHPSSLLRADDADRETNVARFIADLKAAAKIMKKVRAHVA